MRSRLTRFALLIGFACGIFLLMTNLCIASKEATPLICIDPGHPSEVSAGDALQNGAREVTICWQVARKLRENLEKMGLRVIMTKSTERERVTNRRRAEIANEAEATLGIRLHCDTGKHSGYALYYPDRQGTVDGTTGPDAGIIRASQKAAMAVHGPLAKILQSKLKDGGVLGDSKTFIGGKHGALTGSIFSKVPVVLIEMAVLTRKSDVQFINSASGQTIMAEALAQGLANAVKTKKRP